MLRGFRSNLTNTDKAILLHKHEANRNRFFGNVEKTKYHNYMASMIKHISESIKERHEDTIR